MLIAALVLAAAAPARAQWHYEPDEEEGKKAWEELEVEPPPPPRTENLIAFDPGGPTPHRFYIDGTSLSVGADGVVRYTLVIRTAGGATNTTFEGMRCKTQEQKVYAVGNRDGKWVQARDPRWKRIESRDLNRHHGVLYAEFMCPERHVRMITAKQILASLRKASAAVR
jgi:hypothetical protein